MPYKIVRPSPPNSDPEMVADIVAELKKEPTEPSPRSMSLAEMGRMSFPEMSSTRPGPPSDAPDITEEHTQRGLIHVTVIWDKWGHIAAEQRGRVILDAYREALGEEKARAVSIAMGLTHAEAERLGETKRLGIG